MVSEWCTRTDVPMEREIIRLEMLCRAALDTPAPTARDKLVAETLLQCLREWHAAAARMARGHGEEQRPRLVRRD
jgi:hypothetical protein